MTPPLASLPPPGLRWREAGGGEGEDAAMVVEEEEERLHLRCGGEEGRGRAPPPRACGGGPLRLR